MSGDRGWVGDGASGIAGEFDGGELERMNRAAQINTFGEG